MSAFFNPFGWSDQERDNIRRWVRPITQSAAVLSSLGVTFASKGATDTVAGDTSAAASADLMKPAELDPTGLNPMQTQELKAAQDAHNDWLLDNQQAAAAGGSLETANQPNIGEQPGTYIDHSDTVRSLDESAEAIGADKFFEPGDIVEQIQQQEMLDRSFQANQGPIKLAVEPHEIGTDVVEPFDGKEVKQYEVGDKLDPNENDWGNVHSFTSNKKGEFEVTGLTPESTQTTAEQVSTDANDISAATPDANQSTQTTQTTRQKEQATKVDQKTGQTDQETTEDTRGKGGKKDEDKFWDLHDFSWENLGKWLETKEGRKFFLEWGAKFTAMSGGAAPNRKKLTKKQAAAIRKKVKEKYGR